MHFGHAFTDEGVELLKRSRALRQQVLEYTVHIKSQLAQQKIPLDVLVDIVYCLREIRDTSDHSRKEASLTSDEAEKLCCAAWLIEATTDPELNKKVLGHIAEAYPRIGTGANLPERGTPEWHTVMTQLGVPEEHRDVVSIKWPAFCELLTQRAEKGLAPPPGIDPRKTYNKYTLTRIKLKQGVNIEEV